MDKGGSYELEIAKKLSLWFTNNERDDVSTWLFINPERFNKLVSMYLEEEV